MHLFWISWVSLLGVFGLLSKRTQFNRILFAGALLTFGIKLGNYSLWFCAKCLNLPLARKGVLLVVVRLFIILLCTSPSTPTIRILMTFMHRSLCWFAMTLCFLLFVNLRGRALKLLRKWLLVIFLRTRDWSALSCWFFRYNLDSWKRFKYLLGFFHPLL